MTNHLLKTSLILLCLSLSYACKKETLIPPPNISVNMPADTIYLAAIGDYGTGDSNEEKVAELVKNQLPELIITMGDNNYSKGKSKTIVENIGDYYCDYIYNFDAPSDQVCQGKAAEEQINRFFPSLGNHDYANRNENIPYLNYFSLPNNEVYYDFVWGPIHFFALDSNQDIAEQQNWFYEELDTAEEAFKVVYFHHSPYCSGKHGEDSEMQWDFSGVDLVLTGHDHIYERIQKVGEESPVYIVNGLGGRSKRQCNENPLDTNTFDSFCYDGNYGALFISANQTNLVAEFININEEMIDRIEINK